jgi:hypothetical protein
MKKITTVLLLLVMLTFSASAEIKSIDMTIFGMD